MTPGAETHFEGRRRVVIEGVKPEIDAGRFAIKRTTGETVRVEADIFTDGHDAIAGRVLHRRACDPAWAEIATEPLGNDRWYAEFTVSELGCYLYTVEAWVDHFLSWRRDLTKRIAADQDTAIDYQIGAEYVDAAASRANGPDAVWLRDTAGILRSPGEQSRKRQVGLDETLERLMARYPDRRFASRYERELPVTVEPLRARFSAWYEFFPRSAGTLNDAAAHLQYVAGMGFDVVYLPPIHPIGTIFRKGRNNAVNATRNDVGSPWAIASHKSVHEDLGSIEDFDRFVLRARELGLEVALDIAFQTSPDHPYVNEHEEWFRKRPDNTIQYAENPPKKYQDIYPFDFESEAWPALWNELKSVFEHWIAHGVRIFRVDNPHTKPFPFWQWVIAEIKRDYPDVLFLAEAFTRPKVMYRLGKIGFSQSYTYFPWRNTKYELTTYLTELTQTDVREYFRANHWPNTPDILTEYLQTSGRSGFMQRLILAATLGANYGIYGPAFELLAVQPREQGSEEYLNSEKYELRKWNLENADSLRDLIALVNRIRRDNAALQNDWSLRFHEVANEEIICYSKRSDDNIIVVAVNLDPYHTQSGYIELPLDERFQVHELLTNARYIWSGSRHYIELNPASIPAHIFRVRRRVRTEREFEYFL